MRSFIEKKSAMNIAAAIIILGAAGAGCRNCPETCPGAGGEFAFEMEEVKTAVENAAAGLGGLSSRPDFVEIVREYIAPVRFLEDGSGYFFVYDTNGVVIAHAADKDLVGKNLYSLTDKTGKYFIRDKITAAKAGGGYVTYYWPAPKTKEIKKKKVYVKMIPGTDYLIGSGAYFR